MILIPPGVACPSVAGSQRHETTRGLDSEVVGATALLWSCERQDSVQGSTEDRGFESCGLQFIDTLKQVFDIGNGFQKLRQVIEPLARK